MTGNEKKKKKKTVRLKNTCEASLDYVHTSYSDIHVFCNALGDRPYYYEGAAKRNMTRNENTMTFTACIAPYVDQINTIHLPSS